MTADIAALIARPSGRGYEVRLSTDKPKRSHVGLFYTERSESIEQTVNLTRKIHTLIISAGPALGRAQSAPDLRSRFDPKAVAEDRGRWGQPKLACGECLPA